MDSEKSRKRGAKDGEDDGLCGLKKARRLDYNGELEQDDDGLELAHKKPREPQLDVVDDEVEEAKADESEQNQTAPPTEASEKVARLMALAGYREGAGLGKHEQGRLQPVESSLHKGRLGLGHEQTKPGDFDYDAESEITAIEENPLWLECDEAVREEISAGIDDQWIRPIEPKKLTIDDEVRYCSGELIKELLECKQVFDVLDSRTLNHARARANPYETIKGGIFQNRAAMKAANVDRIFDWRLSWEFDRERRLAKNPVEGDVRPDNVDREAPLFYFADVCAGPGGFSEYMLWRKAFYNAKGFGFTLCNNDDFKLDKFKAASSEYFQTFYGSVGDGDIYNPENLTSLERFIRVKTDGRGVHLVMCDGGFSVEGKENIQEILSKRLYCCQFIAGLALPRCEVGARGGGDGTESAGGNFFCKLFDIFTPFSVGLVYLLYCAFRRISLHKPLTSRPANSERYIFCEGLTRFGATVIKDYLVKINNRLEAMGSTDKQDIYEVVPAEVMAADERFYNYVVNHNERTIRRQIFYLKKYRLFAQDPGKYDAKQGELKDQCLHYYELPPGRHEPKRFQPATLAFKTLVPRQEMELERDWVGATPPFTLDILRQRSAKNLVSHEFCVTLLPESLEPALLISNSGGVVTMCNRDGTFSSLDHLHMPPNTLLLVQVTEKYQPAKMSDGEASALQRVAGSDHNDVIYVIDAGWLDGDDVSHLPFDSRLAAVRKFCTAINKHKAFPSNRAGAVSVDGRSQQRRPSSEVRSGLKFVSEHSEDQNEFIAAHTLSIHKFATKEFPIYHSRGSKVAAMEIVGTSGKPFLLKVQSARFSRILKENFTIQWSASQQTRYYYNCAANAPTFKLEEGQYSTFFDSLTDRPPEAKATIWRWTPNSRDSYRDADIASVLNSNAPKNGEPDGRLTLATIRDAIERERIASGCS